MNFEELSKYSLFACNNLNMKNADCEGNVAVGNNIILENFSVGMGYPPNNHNGETDTLVVGGKVNIKKCVNYNGNTVMQKNRFPQSYKMKNPCGELLVKKVVDFTKSFDTLKEISTRIQEKTSNGIINETEKYTFQLVSIFKDENQFFNLTLDKNFDDEIIIDFLVDNKSPIFINVDCENIKLSKLILMYNSKKCNDDFSKRVVWNFYNAKSIEICNTKFYGTMFAINAKVSLRNSTVHGNIFASDILGDSDIALSKLESSTVKYLNKLINYTPEKFEYSTTSSKTRSNTNTNTYTSSNSKANTYNITNSKTKTDTHTKTKSTTKSLTTSNTKTNTQTLSNINTKTKMDTCSLASSKTKTDTYSNSKTNTNSTTKSFTSTKTKTKNECCFDDEQIYNKRCENMGCKQVFLDVLSSISAQEIGLAKILEAEAHKLKYSVSLAESIEDYIKIDESTTKTIRVIDNIQSLLVYKYEEVLKMLTRFNIDTTNDN